MKADDNRSGIQVIDRLSTLLETLVRNGGSASLKMLSAESGLHPSTAFRILSSAADNGLIDRAEGGQYRMGGKIMQWGCALQGGTNLPEVARPIMEWLRNKVEETVNLTLHEGDEVVYIERVTPRRMMRVEQVIGSHAPLHVTAVGKIFLAEDSASGVMGYAERTGLPAYTANTLTTLDKLRGELETIRRERLAHDREEAELGVACIGAPIRDAEGKLVAGLSISAPADRHKPGWAEALKKAAAQTGAALGYLADA